MTTDTVVISREEINLLKRRLQSATDERDMIWSFMGRKDKTKKMQNDLLLVYPFMRDVLK